MEAKLKALLEKWQARSNVWTAAYPTKEQIEAGERDSFDSHHDLEGNHLDVWDVSAEIDTCIGDLNTLLAGK